MRSLVFLLLGLSRVLNVIAAPSWSFVDGTVSIHSKGASAEAEKQQLNPERPLTAPLSLGPSEILKIILTTTESGTPKRPHQAFLNLRDPVTGLEDSFPLSLKENGKGKVELTHKDLPIQFLSLTSPIHASLVIGSFGSSTPLNSKLFDLAVTRDPSLPIPRPEPPVRYGKLPEIHHTFREGPTSPPRIITLVFTAAVIATVPALLGVWLMLGGNIDHLGKALGSAPASHALFIGSIVALEGIFFMYYTSWNLFRTLPVAGVAGLVTFLSGSRALSEVQGRRLAGAR